ncbi:hypothetical protein KC354_g9209, partial [Hortaea werneckii]
APDTPIQPPLPFSAGESLRHQPPEDLASQLNTRQCSVNNILLTLGHPNNGNHLPTHSVVSRKKL